MENTHISPSRCQWLHVQCINNTVLKMFSRKKGRGATPTSASGDLSGRIKVSKSFHPFKFYSEMIRSAFSDLFPINGFSHPTILLEFIRKVTRGLNAKCCFRQQSSITSLQKGRMISLHQSSVNTHKSIQSLNSSHLFFFYSKTFAL